MWAKGWSGAVLERAPGSAEGARDAAQVDVEPADQVDEDRASVAACRQSAA
jgi:hypothetical protein